MLFVVLIGASIAISPLALAMLWPLPADLPVVVRTRRCPGDHHHPWTVALARNIPRDKLARVSSYDAFGSVMAMPVGAVIASPVAAWAGVSVTQYWAAGLIVLALALALIPRDIRPPARRPTWQAPFGFGGGQVIVVAVSWQPRLAR